MKFNFKSFKKTLLIASVLSIVTVSQALAAVPLVTQSSTNWCWAAADKSLLSYNGITTPTQCQIVNAATGSTNCPDTAATMLRTAAGLSAWNVLSTQYSSYLSFADVKNYSSSGFIIGWVWSSGTTGHIVVGDGYYENYSSAPIQQVYYMDPDSGTRKTIAYASAIGGTNYDRTWVEGLKNIYKKPF
jgi:hypothetical protein